MHQADWLEINDLLRNKGYDPITLVHQSNYNESHGKLFFREEPIVIHVLWLLLVSVLLNKN